MRIVQVSVGSVRMPPREGSAPLQVIFNTSKHLARIGHKVIILDRRYSRDDLPVEEIEGVEIVRLSAIQILASKAPRPIRFFLGELTAAIFALAVSRYLRKNSARIDVIHLHLTSIGLIVSILNRSLRRKMVYTCHLGHWALARERLNLFERIHLLLDSYLMKRVWMVIAGSRSAKESFVSIGRVKADNIIVLSNGVDTDLFSPHVEVNESIAKRYGLEGKLSVLFVGRLSKIKGVVYLLEAANIIVNDFGHKEMLFLLVGTTVFNAVETPVDMGEMLDYIDCHHLRNNVVFTGALSNEDVRSLYLACDVFVLPSLVEANPLVILEAMASGKPIVATKIGSIPDEIRDGWNGFLVDPGDEQQLADKIKYLAENPDERQRMGANSRKFAEEEFDWRIITETLTQVYQKLTRT